jgi:predicted MPP superfamily phosphohydrolase
MMELLRVVHKHYKVVMVGGVHEALFARREGVADRLVA